MIAQGLLGVAWENIFVGLLGAAIVGLILAARGRISDLLIQRKFPVAGDYITKFGDLVDGAEVSVAAPAELQQRGNKIFGSTAMSGREWVLQGTLSSAGYVHGVYFAKDPIDRGIGNFFLRVHNDRRMEGLWSGYDSENGCISSGKYLFKPVRSGSLSRPLTGRDVLTVLRIADEELGPGYLDEAAVRRLGESTGEAFGFVVELGGRVVGFAICELQAQNSARAMIRATVPRHLKYAPTVGVIKTVAITRGEQGQGVGSELVKKCLEEFASREVGAVYSVAWKSGDQINIGGVLERHGFVRFAEVPEYWTEDSLREGFDCPTCGRPPCRCSAVMFSHVI